MSDKCSKCNGIILAETENWEEKFCFSCFISLTASDYIYYFGKELSDKNKIIKELKEELNTVYNLVGNACGALYRVSENNVERLMYAQNIFNNIMDIYHDKKTFY